MALDSGLNQETLHVLEGEAEPRPTVSMRKIGVPESAALLASSSGSDSSMADDGKLDGKYSITIFSRYSTILWVV